MLDYQGFACYSLPVTTCNKTVTNYELKCSVTENVTACYRLPVTDKALYIKGLSGLLQMLQKFHTSPCLCFSKIRGLLWD